MYLVRVVVCTRVVSVIDIGYQHSITTAVHLHLWYSHCHETFQGRTSLSEDVHDVSILFCDIKGFTSISAEVQPPDIVNMLHKLFIGFDSLTDKYNVRTHNRWMHACADVQARRCEAGCRCTDTATRCPVRCSSLS